ncbi:hypothetical protein SCLCIDRAFT_688125 [Scleroderma citrinum Foug A]|uniref:Uncharacterized protein n=1 Tax=Scleroderma citrinum Foug A TaxID=1036808 RepID=A0A0C3E6W0_9AGAM|nr:hypothetical protein SCLCIDRAFT_688125 [Scleroderma citrinum Foug A]
MTQWMRPWIKLAACCFTEWCDRDSSMHQRLHYNGPLTNPSSLSNSPGNVPTANFTGPVSKCCQWQGSDDALRCYLLVDHESVPGHFKTVHGIKDMGRKVKIRCRWLDCQQTVGRHNFTRHIREVHLGSERHKARRIEETALY